MRRWFIRNLPAGMVKLFASPYIAGASPAEALAVATRLAEESGIRATLDILGEEVTSDETAEAFLALYTETLDAIAAAPALGGALRPTLSFKPSALGRVVRREDGSLDEAQSDLDACRERIRRVTAHARTRGVDVTLDMEDHAFTEFTVATATQLAAEGFANFGTVLQTRLHRTAADIERIPAGMRIRLVIGIYEEPESVAITDRRVMKERLLEYGARLLERGARVELATHDEEFIERFMVEVMAPRAIPRERVEFQFLLGVPRGRIQRELAAGGLTVRLYVPFARHWDDAVAYARRRLYENPAIMSYGLKNLLTTGRR